MDDVMVRSRYARHGAPASRRKRKNIRESNTLAQHMVKQLVICVAVLVVVGIVKSIDTGFTNFLSNQVKWVLQQDVNMDTVYQGVDGFFGRLFKGETDDGKTQTGDQDQASDTNATGDTSETDSLLSTMLVPVEGPVSSPFGNRVHPVKKTVEMHTGIDIEAVKGASIKAALDGEVIEAGEDKVYGNYLKIRDNDRIVTLYGHCSKLIAEKGQKVARGTVIAQVGDTGVAVGTHLHFEIQVDGKAVDPLNYLKLQVG